MTSPKSRRAVWILVPWLAACVAEAPPVAAVAPRAAPAAPSKPAAPPAQAFAEHAPEYAFADSDRMKKIQAAFAAIDEAAERTMKSQELPGLAIGVVVDGQLVHEKGFGVVDFDTKAAPDADTVYRIGSITKSFTALGLLALRDEGKLSLDEPLVRLVPEAAGLVYPTRDARPITLRQLLTHTSGLPRSGNFDPTRTDVGPTEREVLASLDHYALENPPGATFLYSNLGFALLGIATGRAAGTSYRAHIAAKLFEPLGMTSSGFDAADVPNGKLATPYRPGPGGKRVKTKPWMLGADEGGGGIYSSVRDMARYVAFQLAAYPPRDAPEEGPIRRASVREAHGQGLAHGLSVRARDAARGEPIVDARARAYSFGWGVADSCELEGVVSHDGAVDGFASSIAFVPESGIGFVALTNYVEADLNGLFEKAFLAIKKTGGLSRRTRVIRPDPAFESAMEKFLRVYDHWDEAEYHAMLTPDRPTRITAKAEQDELAGYKALHGACKGYTPTTFFSPFRAEVAMQCERGTLAMTVALNPKDGKIGGFGGTSKGLPIPPKLAKVAAAIGSLTAKWDDRLYKKHLAPRGTRPREEAIAFYDRIRAGHGACKPTTAERDGNDEYAILLGCEKGGDLRLRLKLDEKDPDAIVEYTIMNASNAKETCPVK